MLAPSTYSGNLLVQSRGASGLLGSTFSEYVLPDCWSEIRGWRNWFDLGKAGLRAGRALVRRNMFISFSVLSHEKDDDSTGSRGVAMFCR